MTSKPFSLATTPILGQPPRPLRILVVDDDAPVRDSLVAFLRDLEYLVESAERADKALTLVEAGCFDIAIIDLRLPGMGGQCLTLRIHEISPKTRFLIHTGCSDYALSPELSDIGVRPDQVFYKPQADLRVLTDRIKAMML